LKEKLPHFHKRKVKSTKFSNSFYFIVLIVGVLLFAVVSVVSYRNIFFEKQSKESLLHQIIKGSSKKSELASYEWLRSLVGGAEREKLSLSPSLLDSKIILKKLKSSLMSPDQSRLSQALLGVLSFSPISCEKVENLYKEEKERFSDSEKEKFFYLLSQVYVQNCSQRQEESLQFLESLRDVSKNSLVFVYAAMARDLGCSQKILNKLQVIQEKEYSREASLALLRCDSSFSRSFVKNEFSSLDKMKKILLSDPQRRAILAFFEAFKDSSFVKQYESEIQDYSSGFRDIKIRSKILELFKVP